MSSIGGINQPQAIMPMDPSQQLASADLAMLLAVSSNKMQEMTGKLGAETKTNSDQLSQLMEAANRLKEAKDGIAQKVDPRLADLMKAADQIKAAMKSLPPGSPVASILQAQLNVMQQQIAQLSPPSPGGGGSSLSPADAQKLRDLKQMAGALEKTLAAAPPMLRGILQGQLADVQKQISQLEAKANLPPAGGPSGLSAADAQRLKELSAAADNLHKAISAAPPFLRPVLQVQLATVTKQIDQLQAKARPEPPTVDAMKAQMEAMLAAMRNGVQGGVNQLQQQVASLESMMGALQRQQASMMQAMMKSQL
jgi:predicted  nucleic acid-binding Zn-ribbon protein